MVARWVNYLVNKGVGTSLDLVPMRLYMTNFLAVVSWYVSRNLLHTLAFMYFTFQCESGCFLFAGESFFRPLWWCIDKSESPRFPRGVGEPPQWMKHRSLHARPSGFPCSWIFCRIFWLSGCFLSILSSPLSTTVTFNQGLKQAWKWPE